MQTSRQRDHDRRNARPATEAQREYLADLTAALDRKGTVDTEDNHAALMDWDRVTSPEASRLIEEAKELKEDLDHDG